LPVWYGECFCEQRGHRRTDIERLYTSAALLLRLNELTPRLFYRATTDPIADNYDTRQDRKAKLAVNG
jgi:hypothetical protein